MVYPTVEEMAVIESAKKFMEESMATNDPSHDPFHVYRVRETALRIAHCISSQLPAKLDFLTIELAALLHDVLDKKYVSAEAASANPYTFFLPFFQSLPVDLVSDGRAKQVVRIVENVSWSTEKKLREEGLWGEWHEGCLELHCVQDADRLDAMGAFGIMRCAAYSAIMNRALHTPPNNVLCQDSAIQHFHDKLLHLQDQLKTNPGRRMGEKRHQFMLQFLTSVEEEYYHLDLL